MNKINIHCLNLWIEWRVSILNGEKGYSFQQLKNKLKEWYKDKIIITKINGKSTIVSFSDSAYKILHKKLKTDSETNKMSENEKLVIMAASVIRDEIKSAKYNVSKHPTLEET